MRPEEMQETIDKVSMTLSNMRKNKFTGRYTVCFDVNTGGVRHAEHTICTIVCRGPKTIEQLVKEVLVG